MSDSSPSKRRYYIGRWNGKRAKVESLNSFEEDYPPVSQVNRSSELFDSVLNDATLCNVNRQEHSTSTIRSRVTKPIANTYLIKPQTVSFNRFELSSDEEKDFVKPISIPPDPKSPLHAEVNFLGEPVNQELSLPADTALNDKKESRISKFNNFGVSNIQVKSRENEKPFNVCIKNENVANFDSDYFSQESPSQSQESPFRKVSRSDLARTPVNQVSGSFEKCSDAVDSVLHLTEPAPLSLKATKKNFLKSGTGTRKSPLKARYNARAWTSSGADSPTVSSSTTSSKNNFDFDDIDVDEDVSNKTSAIQIEAAKSVRYKGVSSNVSSLLQEESSTKYDTTGTTSQFAVPVMLASKTGLDRFEATQFLDEGQINAESVKVSRKEKELYTVVRSVKSMQTTLEDGESQMFSEDMQYMLEGLGGPGVSLSTRCLSLLSMATKATQSNFRVHFRAQLILPRICILMKDAPVHPALALATSLLLYVLSRDKIPLHLDIYALALVIRLIKNEETADWTSNRINATNSDKEKSEKNELFKVKTKLKKVLISLPDSASKLLCLSEEVSPSALSLEVLLSVYCEKSKWTDGFKTQIMKSGAIEYVGKAYTLSADAVTQQKLYSLLGAEEREMLELHIQRLLRCSTLIENVTHSHHENQKQLIQNDGIRIIQSATRVFKFLVKSVGENRHESEKTDEAKPSTSENDHSELDNYNLQPSKAEQSLDSDQLQFSLQDCLIESLGICLNLTNDSELGSTKMGNETEMLACLVDCALHIPGKVSSAKKFDITIMSLGLLINLLDCSPLNRRQFMVLKTKVPPGVLMQRESHKSKTRCKNNPMKDVQQNDRNREVSAVEAFVLLFCSQEQLVEKIEAEEKLNETDADSHSNDEMTSGKESVRRSQRRRTKPAATDSAAFAGAEYNDRRASSGGNGFDSSSDFEWSDDKTPMGNGTNKQQTFDDEFVEDEEGGLVWVGKKKSGANNSSDESSLCPKKRSEMEQQQRLDVLEQALCAAGRHMESCMTAAYAALLIGCILQGNMNNVKTVLQFVPSGNFSSMIKQLERLHKFMSLTTAADSPLMASISDQITVLTEANQKASTLEDTF